MKKQKVKEVVKMGNESEKDSKVLIIMGSKSDMGIAKKAEEVLERLGIGYRVEVASAHRDADRVRKIVSEAKEDVIIAIAGLSAALPGFIASHTIKPVIGVPVSASLLGIDALLSIAQLPSGIVAAAVGIDNAANAAILAAEILTLKYEEIKIRLLNFREEMKNQR